MHDAYGARLEAALLLADWGRGCGEGSGTLGGRHTEGLMWGGGGEQSAKLDTGSRWRPCGRERNGGTEETSWGAWTKPDVVGDVYLLVFDFPVDDLSTLDEGSVHVLSRLGGGLDEEEAVLVGKGLAFGCRDLAAGLQVGLVSDKDDGHVRAGMLASILQPCRQVVKSFATGDIINKKAAGGPAIV